MQDFVFDLSLFTCVHASGVGASAERRSRLPSPPAPDHPGSSVMFVDDVKPGVTGTGKTGTGEQEHESPALPKLASESERERGRIGNPS